MIPFPDDYPYRDLTKGEVRRFFQPSEVGVAVFRRIRERAELGYVLTWDGSWWWVLGSVRVPAERISVYPLIDRGFVVELRPGEFHVASSGPRMPQSRCGKPTRKCVLDRGHKGPCRPAGCNFDGTSIYEESSP